MPQCDLAVSDLLERADAAFTWLAIPASYSGDNLPQTTMMESACFPLEQGASLHPLGHDAGTA
jgi:hypothetical protein